MKTLYDRKKASCCCQMNEPGIVTDRSQLICLFLRGDLWVRYCASEIPTLMV